MKFRILFFPGLFIVMSFLSKSLVGQQLQSWSSFYENGFIHNPALTARWNFAEASISHRQNWTGFENAPEYTLLAFQYPFLRKITRVTVGAFVEQDEVGPYSSESVCATYTYKLRPKLFNQSKDVLSFGLKTGLRRHSFNPGKVLAFDGFEGDPLIPNMTSSNLDPTIDIGVFYNSINDYDPRNVMLKSHFFFGIAIRDLINSNRIIVPAGVVSAVPHISFHGGYRYAPKRQRHYFEHNYLVDYAFNKAWLAMYNFRFERLDKYWLSAGGVSNGEVFLQAGVIVSGWDNLRWLLSKSGALRIGAKANYNFFQFGNYAGVGFEAYVAYQFQLD